MSLVTVGAPLSYYSSLILNGSAVDIEKQLTVSDENSTEAKPIPFVPLANGCICCSVKDVGVAAIENLMEMRGNFDYILLETTGLADPGNIAPMFWLDDGLGSSIFLDGIVTLVDAKNVLKSLDEGFGDENAKELEQHEGHDEHGPLLTTAHLQISHADVILVNKADLVSEEELETVIARIRSINGLARIEITTKSRVAQLEGSLLDLHAYDQVTDADLKFASKGHSHLDPVGCRLALWSCSILISCRPSPPLPLTSLLSGRSKWITSISFCAACSGTKRSPPMSRARSLRYIG